MSQPVKPDPEPHSKDAAMSTTQLELTKAMLAATAEITAAMVTVTTEKNPAKICEAFRVIYKAVAETVKPPTKKSAV